MWYKVSNSSSSCCFDNQHGYNMSVSGTSGNNNINQSFSVRINIAGDYYLLGVYGYRIGENNTKYLYVNKNGSRIWTAPSLTGWTINTTTFSLDEGDEAFIYGGIKNNYGNNAFLVGYCLKVG